MELERNSSKAVLAAAVRAATNVSDDQLNEHHRGVVVAINMTAVPGGGASVTFAIDGKDPVTGAYYNILTSAAITVAETRATGNVTLTGGASGSVNTVLVGGVALIVAAVPFNTSLNQTATDLAAAINARTSITGYSASPAGAIVTITAPAGTGTLPNGYIVAATATTITFTTDNLSGGVSGTTILKVYPGVTVAANVAVSDVLPRAWRVRAIHSAGTNFTYGVSALGML